MRQLKMTDEAWRALLALKKGEDAGTLASSDPAYRIYEPVARNRDKPFVIAQIGQSLDGRVATHSGDARDISGVDGIAHLHRLRALVDAVVVGVGTVVADDPRLTVRVVEGECPARVVVDPNRRLPGDAVLHQSHSLQTLVICREAARSDADDKDGNIVALPCEDGHLRPADIVAALVARGLRRILVEGGGRTIARFIEADAIDRLHVSVSPFLIGSGLSGLNLSPIDRLDSIRRPRSATYDLGTDVLFDLDLSPDPLPRTE